MKLYERLPTTIEYNNRVFKLKPYFNNILFCLEIFDREDLSDIEKVDTCIKALVKNRFIQLDIVGKTELLNAIFKMLFDDKKKSTKNQKSFDFVQDSKYIYAGFMQCYGIDLFQYRNKLHWWSFISLFQGMSNDTRMMQIIEIRTKPIPAPTQYNGEIRQALLKQKAEFALEMTQEERERQFNEGLNDLFDKLVGMAEMR